MELMVAMEVFAVMEVMAQEYQRQSDEIATKALDCYQAVHSLIKQC